MKFRTTLVLLILAAALIYVLLFHTALLPGDREYWGEQRRVFPAREFDAPSSFDRKRLSDVVARLELRDRGSAIVLVRDPGSEKVQWRIEQPVRAVADAGKVAAILKFLEVMDAQATLRDEPGSALDLEAYGLEDPQRSITFSTDEKSWTLNVGEKTADGKGVYVMRTDLAEPAVLVVSSEILDRAFIGVAGLRDRRALRFNANRVTRIQVCADGRTEIECHRTASVWSLVKPVMDRADPLAVIGLLRALELLRVDADDFVAEDAEHVARFGLDKPSFSVVLFEGDTERALLFGDDAANREGKVYAMRRDEPFVFALKKRHREALRKIAARLRSTRALAFDVNAVAAVAVNVNGQAVKLERSGDDWQMTEPPGLAADSGRVAAFLSELHNLEVRGWIDEPTAEQVAEAGLTAPPAAIFLTMKDSPIVQQLAFGNPDSGIELCHARRGKGGPILLVPRSILTRLAGGHLAFLSMMVMEFERDDVVAMRIVRPDGTFRLEKRGGRWMVLEPQRTDADTAAVDEMLWTLCHLEAKRLVTGKYKNLQEFGLDEPLITITISLNAGRAEKTLYVGRESADGANFAMAEGDQRVFLIGKSAVDALTAKLAMEE